MNKRKKYGLIGASIFVSIFICYWIIDYKLLHPRYIIRSPNMYPTLRVNQVVRTSPRKEYKANDIIVYNDIDPASQTTTRYIARLVADEGDEIQLIRNIAWINGKREPDTGYICRYCRIPVSESYAIAEYFHMDASGFFADNDSVIAEIPYRQLDSIKTKFGILPRVLPLLTDHPEFRFKNPVRNWNLHTFGPVKIPKGYVFIMGDNRVNSFDSRFRGFIRKSEIVGIVEL